MRVLITGMNRNQTTRDYFRTQELQVVPSHYSLIRCLEDMGHEVEQREVELGEDISGYDEVIIYVHNLQGFAHCLYTGLYAVSKRPNAVLAFDDWQVRDILNSVVKFGEHIANGNEGRVIKDYIIDIQTKKRSKELLRKYVGAFAEGIKVISSKSNRLLVSAFAGGDLELLKTGWPADRVFRFNPNPYHLNRGPGNNYGSDGMFDFPTVSKKRDEWNFASLLHDKTRSWLKRQAPRWPVTMYGQRKGPNATKRVTEDEMCFVFAQDWGCLMPGYFHSGSGWWRARPLQVADAGSVLVCDDAEGRIYGEPYVGLTASAVEEMGEHELRRLANRQRDALYDRHPLIQEVERFEVSAVLEAARG